MSQTVPMRNIMHDAQMESQRNAEERAETIREPMSQPQIITEGAYNRQHDDRMRRNRLARQRMNGQERSLRSIGVLQPNGGRKNKRTKKNRKSKRNNKRTKKSKRRY